MKQILRTFLFVCLYFGLAGCRNTEPNNPTPQGKAETIVYIVRHAEKSNNHPSDPDLTEAGKARAEALKKRLQPEGISAVYSTPYKRTQQTAQPLANVLNLPVQLYEAQDYEALSRKILQENRGKKVLVTGHSNTVLELIEAFHAKRPVETLTESDYDYLFKVNIPEKGTATVSTERYGN